MAQRSQGRWHTPGSCLRRRRRRPVAGDRRSRHATAGRLLGCHCSPRRPLSIYASCVFILLLLSNHQLCTKRNMDMDFSSPFVSKPARSISFRKSSWHVSESLPCAYYCCRLYACFYKKYGGNAATLWARLVGRNLDIQSLYSARFSTVAFRLYLVIIVQPLTN